MLLLVQPAMLNHDTCQAVSKIAPEGAPAETFSPRSRLCDPIYAAIFSHGAKNVRNATQLCGYLVPRKYFRRTVDFSPRTFIPARFTKKRERRGGGKRGKKENSTGGKTERGAFRKISLLSRANISSPMTDVERTRDVQCSRSMTHFAREVTRTVPKLDLIDRLYYLALSTAFCSWNLNHAKIGGSAPSSDRYYNYLNLQRRPE